jgi:hypothetical protein
VFPAAWCESFCSLQQRREIMQYFAFIVNFFSFVHRVFRGFLPVNNTLIWWSFSTGGEL